MANETQKERREYVDALARADIIHLKEITHVNDRRYEQRFNAQEVAIFAALTAQKEALAAALAAQKESTQKEADAAERRFIALSEQLTVLQQRVDLNFGKGAGATAMWGYFVGVVGLLAAIVSIYALLKS